VLADVGGYPRWWPPSLGLRVLSGGVEPLGTEVEIRPFGGRSFRCRVDKVDELQRMRMRYYGGFLEGFGEWRLEPAGRGTRVIYHLDVQAHGRLAAFLGNVINLARLHSRLMQGVLRNLNRVLLQDQRLTGEVR
jgi:carbon monoxide dehydrogenase subunit G